MSAPRIALSSTRYADLLRAVQDRENTITRLVLQQPDYPPLPPCPACGAAPDQIDSMVEPPEFNAYEICILIKFAPCGHAFRSSVDWETL